MATQPYTEVPPPEHEDAEESLDKEELHHEEPASRPRRWYLGNDMGKRIVGVIVVVLILATLWYAYRKRSSQAGDGAVQFEDNTSALTDETKPASSSASTVTTPADTSKRNIVQPTTNVQPPLAGATVASPAAVPATDSIAANPANGMAFTGSGKFQVYRQGNLTWRVDTETGHTCILFATMEEWRKPIVYQHGCNNS